MSYQHSSLSSRWFEIAQRLEVATDVMLCYVVMLYVIKNR